MARPVRLVPPPTPSANHTAVVRRPTFGHPAGGPRRWELVHEGERPTPMNKYRTLHFRDRAVYDRNWRATFGWLARAHRLPHLDAVIVTVIQECKGGTLPDPGNNYPTAKAAIDGLVDAGVIDNDTGEFVRFIGFAAPTHGDEDRFVLVVEEFAPDDTEAAS